MKALLTLFVCVFLFALLYTVEFIILISLNVLLTNRFTRGCAEQAFNRTTFSFVLEKSEV